MVRSILTRLVIGVGIVLGVVTLTFLLLHLAPGDPARLWLGPSAGAADLAETRRALGLDRPLPIQYLTWLSRFLAGDWGTSLAQQRPVVRIVADALPHTLVLSVASLGITYLIGVTLGVLQATRPRSRFDRTMTVTSLIVYGMPAYWIAVILVLVFSYLAGRWGLPPWLHFPALGVTSLDAEYLTAWGRLMDRFRHLVLPVATLSLVGVAGTARFARGAVLDVRHLPFVRAARARGLSAGTFQLRYILRNALTPIVTLLGLSLPALFSGTVFVEVIFAWPGMGREIVGAVAGRDYPVVMASTAIFAILVVAGNLCADLLHTALDPRVRTLR